MPVATDPNSATLADSDEGFDKAFDEFAAGKVPPPAPDQEGQNGDDEPGDDGPELPQPAPAKPAATEKETPETAPPGDAEPDGGGQPPAGQEAPDLWANAPPELIAERDRIQKERDEALHKASSDANRVAALSRKLQSLQTPASAPPAPAEPSEAQKALDSKIAQLREDYGDIADPLIELIESQKKELTDVRTVLTGLNEERQAQVIASEQQALEARHPDWRDIAQNPVFAGWLEVQPENIQRLATSWDARETSVVLTLFKAENVEANGQQAAKPKANAATGARRSQQLDGGRDVGSRPAPAASDAPEDFDAAFDFYTQKRLAKDPQLRR